MDVATVLSLPILDENATVREKQDNRKDSGCQNSVGKQCCPDSVDLVFYVIMSNCIEFH